MRSERGVCVRRCFVAVCAMLGAWPTAAGAQLLDRVLARIGTEAITQTDVQALLEFGLAEGKAATDPAAIRQAIDRQLELKEVARFPPPEPAPDAVDQLLATMKARVGDRLEAVMQVNGLNEARLRGLARDTLRIRQYLDQRFGLATQVSEDEARKYYEEHRDQFTRDGQTLSFEEAAAAARQGAAAERLERSVTQWVQDLRSRSDVVLVTNP